MRLQGTASWVQVLLFAAGCAHGGPGPAREYERLEQRQAGFLAAMSAGDPEATAVHFAEDGVVHVANLPPVRGRDAIHQFYARVFTFQRASTATPELLSVSSSADLAFGVGRVSNAFQGPQGAVEYTGKYLVIWAKRGGEWQVAAYSISNNEPEGGGRGRESP